MTASKPLLRIGAVAEQAGVSTRTLRYYEEFGLLTPSGRSPGGARHYTDADLERVKHIRRLQTLMGFDLDRIRVFLTAEDELARLRAEYSAGPPPERETEIAAEAVALYSRMVVEVTAKVAALQDFLAELEEKAARARRVALTGRESTSG
jgi:MerR family transcriptional regulator, repressor of the yfmOP operon